MNFYLDNQLIRKMSSSEDQVKNTTLLNIYAKAIDPYFKSGKFQFILEWPSFLEYLGFGSMLENYPKIDPQNKIFSSVIEVLKMDSDKEVIHYLYDQIFVESLTQIKKLPQLHPQLLINQIQNKRKKPLFLGIEDPFGLALNTYEKKLSETPYEAIHDLTLYLAWERVCIFLGAIFDNTTLTTKNGLEILKDCLIESYRHIKLQGKTSPSFIRLVEALFAFHMKEENLQVHTENEWQVFCKGVETLHPGEEFPNASYIDLGIAQEGQTIQKIPVLTMESDEKAKARIDLANQMIATLKKQDPEWHFFLHPFEIFSIKGSHTEFLVE